MIVYKFVDCHVHTHAHTHTTHVVCVCLCDVCVCVCLCLYDVYGCVCACAWVCLCIHVCVCLMCVYLAFRVMLNGMTKVATLLLASSSSFLTRNTCCMEAHICIYVYICQDGGAVGFR